MVGRVRVLERFVGLYCMALKEYLGDYSQRADDYLGKFFQEQVVAAEKFDTPSLGNDFLKQFGKEYREFMRGGKKVRGALVQLGFEIAGGNTIDILPASAGMEVIHSFLLMHDDVEDQDDLRRGRQTIHKIFGSLSKQRGHANSDHWGMAQAINLGDLGCFWGIRLLVQCNLPAERIVSGIQYLQDFLVDTGYGQIMDLAYEAVDPMTEPEVLQVHHYKSAQYTISGPLKLGGILGGMTNGRLEAMVAYGNAVGTAFQLRDDELGLYGDEVKLGKPVGSDIRAGKNTLLKVKAWELSNDEQRNILKQAYGNAHVTNDQIQLVQEITKETGALQYSQDLCLRLAEKGNVEVEKISDTQKHREILFELVDYVCKREV